MKTEKITINKTPQQPDGVQIEIVVPQEDMEERLLSFLLVGFLRDLKQNNRIPYELPERFIVEHRGNGTFVAFTVPGGQGPFYEQRKPIAMFGIRTFSGRFDLVHAPVGLPSGGQPIPSTQPAAADTKAEELPAQDPEPNP